MYFKIPADLVQSRFGYMLEAFSYGAPPHGGIALGLDRLVTILCNRDSIRDVIAFPKTQKGQDLMTDSPGEATDRQLRDLKIKIDRRGRLILSSTKFPLLMWGILNIMFA